MYRITSRVQIKWHEPRARLSCHPNRRRVELAGPDRERFTRIVRFVAGQVHHRSGRIGVVIHRGPAETGERLIVDESSVQLRNSRRNSRNGHGV